jgi:hypothetical protein
VRRGIRLDEVPPPPKEPRKLHLLPDHDGSLPSYAVVIQGRVHENKWRKLKLQRGTMLVFDRGTRPREVPQADLGGTSFCDASQENAAGRAFWRTNSNHLGLPDAVVLADP